MTKLRSQVEWSKMPRSVRAGTTRNQTGIHHMKLRSKFYVGIIVVFGLLAVLVSLLTVWFVDTTVVAYSTNQVKLDINSAWLIYNSRAEMIRRLVEFVAEQQAGNERPLVQNRDKLENFKHRNGLDILNLISLDETALLRTNPPYAHDDSVKGDALVAKVLATHRPVSGTILMPQQRLVAEGGDLLERCEKSGGEAVGMLMGAAVPLVSDGKLTGVLEAGVLLNGATEKVDLIRDLVFESKLYRGKPEGTATIFMKDLRISTNVVDANGKRAIGTRASPEVIRRVLDEGVPWTGRAWVVNTWYLAQYDPITDPNGVIIGMLYVGDLEQRYDDMRSRAVMIYLSAVIVGMTLAFIIFLAISRGILNPLHQLSNATKQLADGELSHRVDSVSTKDELEDLSSAFNGMAEQLEKQHTEIEAKQEALVNVNEELRQTNRNYMELLGFVTHELKNPLASAVLSVHTVKDGYLGELNEGQKKSLESVSRSLDYFEDMIRNYLDLSRLEKGEIEVRRSQSDLFSDVLVPIIEGLEREIKENQMVLETNIPQPLMVEADRDLLRIVLDNLLSNALKYGREAGKIVIEAKQDASETVMSVFNEGEGVPAEKLPLLFRKFSRIDGPSHPGKRGTGLGLFICREIIEKHGGHISAESEVRQMDQV